MRPLVVASGQHPGMFHQAMNAFGLRPHVDLPQARATGQQAELVGSLVTALDDLFTELWPAAVVVQGDTSTTLAGALSGFWREIPVVHLEAGLRSGNLAAPFPEEGNRKLVGQIASLHLAPTRAAVRNLAAEGIRGPRVLSVGNTVVDAVLALSASVSAYADPRLEVVEHRARSGARRLVLVTAHRRESWGAPMRRVLSAVAELVASMVDIEVVLPAHPNPQVRHDVHRVLGKTDRVTVTAPLPYPDLVRLLKCATVVLSDSGGIQEEVATFGVPVLVLRDVTERMEAVEAGFATLVGTDEEVIVKTATRLLSDSRAKPLSSVANPFGDGHARYRAEAAIAWHLGLQAAPPDQFPDERAASGS